MANTSSAQKAARQIVKRTEINKTRRSRMRTYVRKVEEAIASGDQGKAVEALRVAQPELVRAANRGLLKTETASRKVSRLAVRVKKMST